MAAMDGHPCCFDWERRTRTEADPYGMTTRKATASARARVLRIGVWGGTFLFFERLVLNEAQHNHQLGLQPLQQ
jgi:hypothetical protein